MRPSNLRHLLGGLAGLVLVSACATSPEKYRSAAEVLSDDIVAQLEKRTDPRHVRVLVYEFQPCAAPQTPTPYRGAGHSEVHFVRQLRHQIMSALAPKVAVLDSSKAGWRPGNGATGDEGDGGFPEARELGATSALVGNYSVAGKHEILLMARLVDIESNQVLATAEQILTGVDVPHTHR